MEAAPHLACGTPFQAQLQIEAIQQGAGEALPVALPLTCGAAATMLPITMPTTGAGVGGGHEGYGCGKRRLEACTAEADGSLFEWLTQLIQQRPRKFRQLIEKQHASMGQAQLSGLRTDTAPDQCGGRAAVMRCPEGPLLQQMQAMLLQLPRNGMDARDHQRLLAAQGRQQLRQLMGQVGFAAARRADQQEMVAAGGCQGQGPCRLSLELDWVLGLWWSLWLGPADPQARALPVELLHQLLQIGCRAHHQPVDQRGFIGIARRNHEGLGTMAGGQLCDGDHATDGPQVAVQSELSGAPDAVEPRTIQLTAGHQQRQGDWQIKRGPLLAQVSWRKVDHHPHQWAAEACIAQGRSHPLPRLLDRFIGQPHQLDSRQPRGQIHFNCDGSGLQALQGCTETTCQHSKQWVDPWGECPACHTRASCSPARTMADDTIFGKILRGEIPCDEVYSDDHCLAFRDIAPQAPVHVLVIPREPIESLRSAGTDHQALRGHLLLVAAKVAKQEGLEDFRTVINSGAAAGQTVFHLHVHVIGGRPLEWPPG